MTTKDVKQQSSNPAQEGRELKEKLKQIRIRAVEFERANNSKLIFFRYGKKFWAAGDITMLVVTNWIVPQLGLKMPRVHEDETWSEDKNGKRSKKNFRYGVIYYNNPRQIKGMMAEVGYELESESEFWLVYKLPKELVPEEIKALKEASQKIIDEINEIVMPKRLDPATEDTIRKMAKLASSDTSASPMSEDKRVLADLTRDIWRNFNMVTLEQVSAEEGYRAILRDITEMNFQIKYILDMGHKNSMQKSELLTLASAGQAIEKIFKLKLDRVIANGDSQEVVRRGDKHKEDL